MNWLTFTIYSSLLMDLQTTLHWVYVALMVGGALLFWVWSRDPKGVPQYEYSIAMMIPLWSALAFTAMFFQPKEKRSLTLLGSLVGADVVMILCGLLADLSASPAIRLTWFLCGMGAFVAVVYLIWGPLRRVATEGGPELAAGYSRLTTFLSVLWVCYPTIWALGPSGLGLLGQPLETALFVFVPFLSKVGFSILDLSFLRQLAPRQPAAA